MFSHEALLSRAVYRALTERELGDLDHLRRSAMKLDRLRQRSGPNAMDDDLSAVNAILGIDQRIELLELATRNGEPTYAGPTALMIHDLLVTQERREPWLAACGTPGCATQTQRFAHLSISSCAPTTPKSLQRYYGPVLKSSISCSE